MKTTLGNLLKIEGFAASHFKSKQNCEAYPLFTHKLIELGPKIAPFVKEFSKHQSLLTIRFASKDERGNLLYSPVQHSKFPYQYTAENMMELEDELEKYEEEANATTVEVDIKESDLVGKDRSEDVPHYFQRAHVELLKGLLICPCIIDIDGTIDRSKEKKNA